MTIRLARFRFWGFKPTGAPLIDTTRSHYAGMELPLLMLDIWKQIWRRLGLRSKGRLELACHAFGHYIWKDSTHYDLVGYSAVKVADRMGIYASKPPLAAGVRRVIQHEPMPRAAAWVGFISKIQSLTHLEIQDNSKEGLINLLAQSATLPPLRRLRLKGNKLKYYAKIKGEGFAHFKTLEFLAIQDVRGLSTAPVKLLEDIALHLGENLTGLSIQMDRAGLLALKAMKALKYLDVGYRRNHEELLDCSNLEKTVALHRATCPPGVGLDVVIDSKNRLTTLLSAVLERKELDKGRHLIEIGADPNIALCEAFGGSHPEYLVVRAIDHGRYDEAKMLLELGAKAFGLDAEQTSVFAFTLLTWKGDNPQWDGFASWLFDEFWPTLSSTTTVEKLLGFPPSQVLFHFMHTIPSSSFLRRTKFVNDRPHIFGTRTLGEVDANGCNLAHHSEVEDDFRFMVENNISWRDLDHAGHTAVQCLAARNNDMALQALIAWCKSDEDFIKHCTPTALANGYGDKFREVVVRMIGLLPPEQANDIIASCIHTSLRRGFSSVLLALLGIKDPEVQARVWKAFFLPLSEISNREWFIKAKVDQKFPLPYHLTDYVVGKVATQIPKYFPSFSEALQWVEEKDPLGRDSDALIRQFATTKLDLKTRLYGLRRLELSQDSWDLKGPKKDK